MVIPLLDGRHTLSEIETEVADVFAPEDLEVGLELLAEHNLLQEADGEKLSADAASRLAPQSNFFHEMEMNEEQMQDRLDNATVTIFGLGGAGAGVAQALAAAGVGKLRCFDSEAVGPADTYLSPLFTQADIADLRTEVVTRRIRESSPDVNFSTSTQVPENDDEVLALIAGSDLVLCCLDEGQSSLIYKLNRACLKANIRWSSCLPAGNEVIIGPTVVPFETPCFLCYKMRTVATAGNPEEEFNYETFLDRRKQDDTGRRENLVFGVGIAANLLSLEALKALSQSLTPSATGKIIVLDLITLESVKHVVLRKPWCPACFKAEAKTRTAGC